MRRCNFLVSIPTYVQPDMSVADKNGAMLPKMLGQNLRCVANMSYWHEIDGPKLANTTSKKKTTKLGKRSHYESSVIQSHLRWELLMRALVQSHMDWELIMRALNEMRAFYECSGKTYYFPHWSILWDRSLIMRALVQSHMGWELSYRLYIIPDYV